MGHLRHGFPRNTLTSKSFNAVSERKCGDQIHFLGNVQKIFYLSLLVNLTKPHEASTHPFRPSVKFHLLDRSTCIDSRAKSSVHQHHDNKRGLSNKRPLSCNRTQLFYRLPVLNDHEMPWLGVAGAWRPSGALQQVVYDFLRNRIRLKTPNRASGSYALEYVQCLYLPVSFLRCPNLIDMDHSTYYLLLMVRFLKPHRLERYHSDKPNPICLILFWTKGKVSSRTNLVL